MTVRGALIAVNSLCDPDKSLSLGRSIKVTSSLMERLVLVSSVVTTSEITITKPHFSVTSVKVSVLTVRSVTNLGGSMDSSDATEMIEYPLKHYLLSNVS